MLSLLFNKFLYTYFVNRHFLSLFVARQKEKENLEEKKEKNTRYNG